MRAKVACSGSNTHPVGRDWRGAQCGIQRREARTRPWKASLGQESAARASPASNRIHQEIPSSPHQQHQRTASVTRHRNARPAHSSLILPTKPGINSLSSIPPAPSRPSKAHTILPTNHLRVPQTNLQPSNMSVDAATAQMATTTLNEPQATAEGTTIGAGGDKPINASQNEAVIASAAEGRRLYIGNLAYATTEGELKDFFKDYLVYVCPGLMIYMTTSS
ncbi:uncharacterized protein RCC_00396 [Ramularia collo-cygni]|uniref:RRM domain-containing protein n=1 Tax=Ramularia collo-cygni TaxID=112498 RepID=A0A2D3UYZ3_9PEZI|nr:uncharacterized protein RCC_00395 [Ramularia collo-cygni]CZT14419.1 uncharacterized protein RCC_00396 [Ramularia collo-cygni]